METDQIKSLVIGAGVIGCAVAQRLAARGYSPFVLDENSIVGEGVTSRNSGVVHASIYYPPKSQKAEMCLKGKALLKSWCREHDVPWKETGKWIVAQEDEVESLQETMKNAVESGATGLSWKSADDLKREVPKVKGAAAIFSSETGIVDPYLFSKSLLDDASLNGCEVLLQTKVLGISQIPSGGYLVKTSRGEIATENVFNCAGLYSDEIARMVGIGKYKIWPWRGDYFRITRDLGVRTLIYPAKKKNAPGLGIHLTVDLDGSCKLGPDVEFVSEKNDFSSREEKRELFFNAAKRYLPELQIDHLQYDTCGIRPKLRGPDDKVEKDFIVSQDLPGFFSLVGIESPGLTAALALADKVISLTEQR